MKKLRWKKLMGIMLVVVMSFTACGKNGEDVDVVNPTESNETPATSESETKDMTEDSAGNEAENIDSAGDSSGNNEKSDNTDSPVLSDHYVETVHWGGLDGNGVEEYLVIENEAGYGSITMYVNEEPVYKYEEELRIVGVDSKEYIDLDHDGQEEIFVSFGPAVNSMPLEEWFVLKQKGDSWELLEMYHYGNDMLDNGFPITVTLQEEPYQLVIACEGCEKEIAFDASAHYALQEKEFGNPSYDAYVSSDFQVGDIVGGPCAYGIWYIRVGEYEEQVCLVAEHGLQGPGGKYDIYGCVDVYFDYDAEGKINILDLVFRPDESVTGGPEHADVQTGSELVLSTEKVADYTSEELIQTAYEECQRIYAKLNSTLNVGSGNLAGKDIELSGLGDGWYEVKDEDFTCIQDIKDYAEAVLTPSFAQEEFYKGLFEGDTASVAEVDGKLYTQLFDGPGLNSLQEITITKNEDGQLNANLAVEDFPNEQVYYMKLRLVQEDTGWRVDGLYYLEDACKSKEEGKLFMRESLVADTELDEAATVIPLPMKATVSVDLDGDGTEELVNTTICMDNGLRFEVPIVRVDNYVFDEEYMENVAKLYMDTPDVATWYLFDIDVTDGYKEIGVYEDGPSGDPYTTLFRYQDGELRKIGGFSDKPIEDWDIYHAAYDGDYLEYVANVDRSKIRITVPGDGTVYARLRVDILETNWAEGLWRLQNAESFEEAVLESELREMYEFYGYGADRGEFTPTVIDTLQVYTEPDFDAEIIVLEQGEEIDFYRYYPTDGRNGWVEISYHDGECFGWLYTSGYHQIYQIEDNGEVLYYAAYGLIQNLSMVD